MKIKKLSLFLILFVALFGCTKISGTSDESIVVQSVVLNKTATSMLVGAKETLSALITPSEAQNKAVAWSTSDAEIAEVSQSGEVTAVSVGTATITVTTKDGAKTATCAVTVSTVVVPVTGVSMSNSALALKVGSTSVLTASVVPANATNQNVVWATSDEAIATVSSTGFVTAIKAGTATITITTQDGAKTATCAVTVSNSVVSVTGVTLNKLTETIPEGSTSALAATVAPALATNKQVSWASSDETVATVSATGVVTAIKAGTANITVTTLDGAKTATCAVTVSAIIPLTVTIGSQTWSNFNVGATTLPSDNWESSMGYYYTWDNAQDVCPTGFKLPSTDDVRTLISNTTYLYSMIGENNIITLTDKNDLTNVLELPTSGFYNDSGILDAVRINFTSWTSTVYGSDSAFIIFCDKDDVNADSVQSKMYRNPARCLKE